MSKGASRFLRVFPWFSGLTGDLLFYIAIDTLFLTIVKGFSPAEIVSIVSLAQLICIVLQFPVLFIIKRIGNTASIRMGASLLLLSAILITFGQSYSVVLLGRVFHDVAAIFKSMSVVALENSLELLDRRADFVRYRTAENTVYAVITMLIAFVAGYMFNLSPYLPMIGCISTCTLGVVLSLFMKDYSAGHKDLGKSRALTRVKIHNNKLVIVALALYALFYAIVTNGQNEGKLFIQQNILLSFDTERTSLIIGAIICVSRVIRVVSNVIFERLYQKHSDQMGIALPTLLGTSIGLMLFGSMIPHVIASIVVMALGYTIILFVRDPFRLYMQDVILASTPKEEHRTLLVVMEFGVKIATAGIGLAFSAMLLHDPMAVVIATMLGISVVEIILGIVLCRAISVGKNVEEHAKNPLS